VLLEGYGLAMRLAAPLALPWLRRRARRGLEDPARLAERLGHAGRPRPPGPLVWLHAASLGETRAVLPLVAAIRARGQGVLVTTATLAANRLAAERLGGQAAVQLAPLDQPQALRRFLDHWRPRLVLLVESEIWPARLVALRERGVPVIVVNGRISAESARRWSMAPKSVRALFGGLSLVLAQGPQDRERFHGLGAPEVAVAGNLKRGAVPLAADPGELAALRASVAGRRVWVAASTHPGEEAAVGAAHLQASLSTPELLSIVVPRHPDRAAEVARAFTECGLTVHRRSVDRLPGPGTGVFLGDGFGELGLWYRLAELAFVGGSLVPRGGHNPIEPALLGCPVLLGPHLDHVTELAEPLLAAGGARRVGDAAALAGALVELLDDEGARAAMAGRARAVAEEGGGVLEAVMQRLAPWLGDA
jgi:3-deoxy-D-manno-octulosonic-acid transferase